MSLIFYKISAELHEKIFSDKNKDLSIFIIGLYSRGSMPTYGKFIFHTLLQLYRQQFKIILCKCKKGMPQRTTPLYKEKFISIQGKIYYLSPHMYQVLAHVTALSVRKLSLGLEWSKAKMVEHQRCPTRRTEDKWSLLQESVGGAQHPLPIQSGNNGAHESINNVTETSKPIQECDTLRDVTNDF